MPAQDKFKNPQISNEDIDLIENAIGRFGKYQAWCLILFALSVLPSVYQFGNVVFLLPSVDYVCVDDDAFNLTNHCPCKTFEYDRSVIFESATSEWDLICDRTALASVAQSMLQFGVLVGSLTFGYISDRYGRRIAMSLALFGQPVFSTISAFVPHYWMFTVLRFLSGCVAGGSILSGYVYMVELSGKSFRPYLLGLQEVSYMAGDIILPIIAYYIRDWRTLQLVTSVPWLVVILYYWFIPESPRWLITVGRKKEAVDILTKIAKKNNRPSDKMEDIVNEIEKESLREDHQKQGNYLDLFKTPKIRAYTIVNALMWMCCAHCYFGINQYMGRVQGNLYLNILISSLSLFPALIMLVVSAVYLRRKMNTIITFAVAAISLLVYIFIPEDIHSAAQATLIIGRLGIYTSFCLVYLYTSEVFPTVIRNSAMGFASMCARCGSFLAPFVVNIGVKWISITIFCSISTCAAIFCCFLPETKDIVLLSSLDQLNDQKKNKHIID